MSCMIFVSAVSLPHEALIHLPLALFLLSPLLILAGAVLPPQPGWPYRMAGLLALGVGSASLFFAVPCAAGVNHGVPQNEDLGGVQWICASLIVETRMIFIGLTLIYGAVVFVPEILQLRDNRLFSTVLPLSFLVLYMAGALFVIQTTNTAAAAITSDLSANAVSAAGDDGSRARVLERK